MEIALQNLADAISKYNLKVPPPSPYPSSEIEGNIIDFFNKFERYAASLYGNDDTSYLQILPNFLEGESKNIVKAFGTSASYPIVKDRLILEFTQRNILGSNQYTDLFNTHRKHEESLLCYSLRLMRMAEKIPNSTKETKNELVKLKFLSVLSTTVAKKLIYNFCNEVDPPID